MPNQFNKNFKHAITCASRKRGDVHKLEFGEDVANAITTINTDSMIGISVHPLSHALEFDGRLRKDVSPCLRATDYKALHCVWYYAGNQYHIRRLTPRECLRLMDVDNSDIDKIQVAGLSKTSMYRLAGNSICVGVLFHIFRKLFIEKGAERGEQLELF